MVGSGRYKLMVFYAGGCPRDEMLNVMLPILAENKIDLLTFGKPNMFDVGKIEQVVHLLVNGTSISEIKSLLKVPGRLKFYQCKYGDNLMKDFDKTKGIIFGLSIGDALGWPTEFISLSQIKSRYGKTGITDLPESAFFTDDSQMSIAIAEALITVGEQDVESIMAAIKYEFIKWKHSPENYRAPGKACLTGIANLENGIHWSKSGVQNSKGCGSAMRVATIGYIYQNDPAKLKEVAHATGICTHGHPTRDAACIGAAYLVKLALDALSVTWGISNFMVWSLYNQTFERWLGDIQKGEIFY
jgi:hypothetical protein